MVDPVVGEIRTTHVWRDSSPGRPWLAGMWEDDWPTQTFTQGEGLPWGAVATLGTGHNPHPDRPGEFVQEFVLRLVDKLNGTIRVPIDFSSIAREGGGRGITVRDEAAIFYHRWWQEDPIMVKLEVPDGDGNGVWRVYTWWEAVPQRMEYRGNGLWVPA